MSELQNPGALLDTRPAEEKKNDAQFKEVVATANPVNWVEKPRSQWRKFPIQNQNGSGSCVAQTMRKIMGVYIWLKTGVFVLLSATHIYKRRQNRPAGGMAGVDAFNIAEQGVTLETLVPSENMNDMQMDAATVLPFMEEIGKVFRIGKRLDVPVKDIETIASIIQTTGKAVMVWFYFALAEWQNIPRVIDTTLDIYAPTTNRHSLAAVDFTLLGQSNVPEYPELWGQHALIIDESWGLGTAINGQRVITEDWFKARNFFCAHFMNFAFEDQTQPTPNPVAKPKHTFSGKLVFGQTSDEVKAMQDCLRYEGVFPINIASTGYYGAITADAVLAFQKKHSVAPTAELEQLAGRVVGPKTIAKLNSIYS